MKLIQVKSVLSKWLLTAILILGFFTFSGLTIQIASQVNKPGSTLVAGTVKKTSRSISYKAALKAVNKCVVSDLISRYSSIQILSFLHNQEADIEIKQASKLFVPKKKIRNFFVIRNYCPSSGDDLPFAG
jgi:hypothetical protein